MLKMFKNKIQYPSRKVKCNYWHIHSAEMHLVFYWWYCDSSSEAGGLYESKEGYEKGILSPLKNLWKFSSLEGLLINCLKTTNLSEFLFHPFPHSGLQTKILSLDVMIFFLWLTVRWVMFPCFHLKNIFIACGS